MSTSIASMINIGPSTVNALGGNVGLYLVFLFVIVISVYVMIQLYNIIRKTDLQTSTIVKDVKDIQSILTKDNGVIHLNVDSEGETVDLPSLRNGTELSLSFWIFIEDFNVTTQPKLITFAGPSDNIANANLIIYLDPAYVKMNVLVKTNIQHSGVQPNMTGIHADKSCSYFRGSIPYVSLQRWMNITVVIDNTYIQLFMDGELRQVIDTVETFKIGDEGTPCNTFIEPLSTLKNFYTGKINFAESMKGYLSKMKFFNYALTIDHAKMLYKTGPVHQSILSKIGVPLYGVRNPFYRVDSTIDDDSKE